MMEIIRSRIVAFGLLPICNLKADRGFFIGSFCFPLCVRCTSIVGAIILTVLVIIFAKVHMKGKGIILWIILMIPCLVDGIMQYGFQIESTNFRRVWTGVLSGIGIGTIIMYGIQFFENRSSKKQKG